MDLDETLPNMGFTTLHKIVLKLSKANLEDQLLLTTAEIDTKCIQYVVSEVLFDISFKFSLAVQIDDDH